MLLLTWSPARNNRSEVLIEPGEHLAGGVLLSRGNVTAFDNRMPGVFGRSAEEPEDRSLDRVYGARDIVAPGQEQCRRATAEAHSIQGFRMRIESRRES